jgi:integrase
VGIFAGILSAGCGYFRRVGILVRILTRKEEPMLKDQQVKNAKPAAESYMLKDERGLFLVVTPSGGKLWRWKYRFGSKHKIMSYGQYPDLSIADAREIHQQTRTLHAKGIDPMARKREVKQEQRQQEAAKDHSFRSVSESWLKHWGGNKSAQHADATRRRLEANVLPLIGSRPVGEIEPSEVVHVVRAIEERGRGDLAKRAFQVMGQIFRHAIANGITENNPVAKLRPGDVLKPTVKENLARVDAKELPALLRDIEIYQGKVITRLGLKLLMLTFLRTSELIEAPWSEIDFQAKRWNIPAERMKMPAPHIVPLSSQAIEVLEMLKKVTGGNRLLFPGEQDPSKAMSNNTLLFAIYRAGWRGKMTGHGARGIASTVLHEHGFLHEHIELQLAHMPRDPVAAAYNHARYIAPRAKMMQWWADYLEAAQRGGKVLEFPAQTA